MFCFDQCLMQSEAIVNAGPAVFINPSGPNPIMVQVIVFTILIFVFAFELL